MNSKFSATAGILYLFLKIRKDLLNTIKCFTLPMQTSDGLYSNRVCNKPNLQMQMHEALCKRAVANKSLLIYKSKYIEILIERAIAASLSWFYQSGHLLFQIPQN